jgi:cation-transporting P-type ATPase E
VPEPLPRIVESARVAASFSGSLGGVTSSTLPLSATPAGGLSEAEAQRRLEARGPVEPTATSRSTASIVRANVFTVFNAILVTFGVVTLVFADWRDALFLFILLSNSAIGIAQELRAKRALDRLAALVAPEATVVRDGQPRRAHVDELVEGDLVRLQPGDQVVADGRVVGSEALMLDESILTGEARAVARGEGEEVRSGSFAVEGSGAYSVTAVGKDSYAERIAGEAREFRHPRSPLERAMNRLLLLLVGVMIPLGAALAYALWERDAGIREAVEVSVAAVVSLVPEGLILLASMTYAVAAVRMARRGALAQQLNAIESLASAEVVCLDKTGTLTEPSIQVLDIAAAPGVAAEELAGALGRYAASSPAPNATLTAIGEAYGADAAEEPRALVPFSSRRRWSALELADRTYVLGAPELFPLGQLAGRAEEEAAAGRRVVAIGTAEGALPAAASADGPPRGLQPLGLVFLAERIRPEARETVAYFLEQRIELKVLSGDAPETVATIARDVGIPVDGVVDASREEPTLEATVVGRISPEGKRAYVERLKAAGRYVVMVGDGVNDVPALKASRLGIAQGSGAQMAKSVADVVLVRGDYGAVPQMVGEGRKILRNLQRVAKLFVTKSVFAAFLILSIGVTPTDYPLLPRHLTLAAALTIGIPGLFLALAPSDGPWSTRGFLREVSSFAVPAGVAAGLGVLSGYLLALNVFDTTLVSARTTATTVLVAVGLFLVLSLEATGGRRTRAVVGLVAGLGLLYLVVLAVPGLRGFFELTVPGLRILLTSIVGAGIAIGFLWLTHERFVPDLRLRSEP